MEMITDPKGEGIFSRRTFFRFGASAGLLVVADRSRLLGSTVSKFPDRGAAATSLPLVNITGGFGGTFDRVRAVDDDTRLSISYPSTPSGLIAGTLANAPAYYGVDFANFPKPNGLHLMRQLFENTPLNFVGFYLAPAPWHTNLSWQNAGAKALLGQGWSVVPIYLGEQQEADPKHPSYPVIPTDPTTAAAHGTNDGQNAANLAANAGFPTGQVIYLDIETSHPVRAGTQAYINAWTQSVSTDGRYLPGAYCLDTRYTPAGTKTPTTVANYIHDNLTTNNVSMWVVKLLLTPANAPQYPLDNNGDVWPASFTPGSAPAFQWQYDTYAQMSQFYTDWPTAPGTIHNDTGATIQLSSYYSAFDFDMAKVPDPGTAGGSPKSQRRVTVSSVSVASSSITSLTGTQLTITLNKPAPTPDGLVVLIRPSIPEIISTSAIRIAAGATTSPVTVLGAPVSSPVSGSIAVRALHQLHGVIPSTNVTVQPPP